MAAVVPVSPPAGAGAAIARSSHSQSPPVCSASRPYSGVTRQSRQARIVRSEA